MLDTGCWVLDAGFWMSRVKSTKPQIISIEYPASSIEYHSAYANNNTLTAMKVGMEIDRQLIDNVKGFLDPEEGRGLYEFGLKASCLGPCLEIGSYCGKSTIYLAAACKKNDSILFSIDHHRGSEEQQPGEEYFDPALFDPLSGRVDTLREFRKTIERAGIEDTVVPMVCRSETAARRWATPLSLVFIDGGHSFEAAHVDYNAWARHILPGGYLLIHDIFSDPNQGGQAPFQIYNLAIASGRFQEVKMVKTLGVLQRTEGALEADILEDA